MNLKKTLKITAEILEVLIVIFALSWFAQTNLFEFTTVKDDGMLPTLSSNNRVLVDKCFINDESSLSRGEIIVFTDNGGEKSIKRVIALAGDKVEIRNGFTYINGKPQYEPYAYTPVTTVFSQIIVPRNHVFVLNDNRAEQNDSRLNGSIPHKRIVGKAVLCYWPWPNLKVL